MNTNPTASVIQNINRIMEQAEAPRNGLGGGKKPNGNLSPAQRVGQYVQSIKSKREELKNGK